MATAAAIAAFKLHNITVIGKIHYVPAFAVIVLPLLGLIGIYVGANYIKNNGASTLPILGILANSAWLLFFAGFIFTVVVLEIRV